MQVTVLAFGQIADLTGSPTLEINGAADTDKLRELLCDRFPGLKDLTFTMAVDKKTVSGNTALLPHSVVALLPPFSGG